MNTEIAEKIKAMLVENLRIPADELERREIAEQERVAEEIRIQELKEKCAKKGLDFDKENQKVLDKRAAKAAKKAAKEAAKELGYPVIVRAAYALGGLGSGFCDNEEQLVTLCESSFSFSPQIQPGVSAPPAPFGAGEWRRFGASKHQNAAASAPNPPVLPPPREGDLFC